MTKDEVKALRIVVAGLAFLRTAVNSGDPQRELDCRVRDEITNIHAILDGNAKMVAGFKPRAR